MPDDFLKHTFNADAQLYLDNSLFELLFFKPFPMVLPYTGRQYANVLNTYSAQAALEPGKREGFLEAIRELIHNQFDDRIQHTSPWPHCGPEETVTHARRHPHWL